MRNSIKRKMISAKKRSKSATKGTPWCIKSINPWKELGDKVQAGEKESIEKAKEELKSALAGDDVEAIKAKSEALSKALYAVTERLYKEAGAQAQQAQDGAPGAGTEANGAPTGDDNVVDADYTVVDDDKNQAINGFGRKGGGFLRLISSYRVAYERTRLLRGARRRTKRQPRRY